MIVKSHYFTIFSEVIDLLSLVIVKSHYFTDISEIVLLGSEKTLGKNWVILVRIEQTPFISCQVIPFWKNGENNKRTERAARKWKVVPRITDDLFMEMGQTVYAERLAKRLTFPFREFTKPSLFQTLSIQGRKTSGFSL